MKNLHFLLDTLQQMHIGDRDVLETLLLSAASAHPDLDVKLHVALIGSTEAGKTDAATKVLRIVPADNQYPTRKVSPKALYYEALNGYSFKNKILFLDDIVGNDTEILKNIANTSSEPPSFSTLIAQEPKQIIFDYAPVVWTTRVELLADDEGQADRRFYTLEVQGSNDVVQYIQESLSNNLKPQLSPEMEKAKKLLKEIMERPGEVTIPPFKPDFKPTKTGMQFLIAMIRSLAKIEGRTTANDEDINEGIRLYKSNQTQMMKLKESARIVMQHIPTLIPTQMEIDEPDTSEHTIEKIYAKVKKQNPKIKIDTVRKDLNMLCKKGYADSITGRSNRHFYYVPV